MADKQGYLDFDEYIRQGEPSQREAAYAWSTAIGLQAVDGLKTSDYLNHLAQRNIEGEITIDEVEQLLNSYYASKSAHEPDDDDREEADKASKNIKRILSTKTFDFTTNGYISLHRRIFTGVMKHAGELRTYDITKREWVLEGDTVSYLNHEDLRRALDYDIEQERRFSYRGINSDDLVAHLASFVSGLWQIHAFGEGNTRTTAVFTIQYLRSLGFNVENDLFAKHAWYFRNALVRANYKSAVKGIDYSPVYLERFFRNLLLGDGWDLRNRYLHIHPPVEWQEQKNLVAVAKVTESGKKVTELGKKSNRVRLTAKQRKVLEFCDGTPRTAQEILDMVGAKYQTKTVQQYTTKLVQLGLLRPTTVAANDPNRKYITTHID